MLQRASRCAVGLPRAHFRCGLAGFPCTNRGSGTSLRIGFDEVEAGYLTLPAISCGCAARSAPIAVEAPPAAAAAPLPLVAPVARWGWAVSECRGWGAVMVDPCDERVASALHMRRPRPTSVSLYNPPSEKFGRIRCPQPARPCAQARTGPLRSRCATLSGHRPPTTRTPGRTSRYLAICSTVGSFPRRKRDFVELRGFQWSTSSSSSVVKRGSQGAAGLAIRCAPCARAPCPSRVDDNVAHASAWVASLAARCTVSCAKRIASCSEACCLPAHRVALLVGGDDGL